MEQLFLVFLLTIYFLPTIVAFYRGQLNRQSVLVINLFFGWTVLGWVIAFAMAVGGELDEGRRGHRQAG